MLNDRICFQSARNEASISETLLETLNVNVLVNILSVVVLMLLALPATFLASTYFLLLASSLAVLFADIECMLCKYSRRSFFFVGTNF